MARKKEQKTQEKQEWALASYVMGDAITDFILSRQAMLCSPRTVEWYSWTLGKFIKWLENEDVTSPDEITARHIRGYLAELRGRDLKASYIHSHARAIKTMMRFFYSEDYLPREVKFDMPKVGKPKLLVLSADEVRRLVKACVSARDIALILFLVDTGVRRAELCSLNWGDVDLQTGLVQIVRGKGGKYRPVVAGIKTRRALLKYRRDVPYGEAVPLFQKIHGKRFTHSGLRSCLLRIGKRAGLKVNCHALRRSFASLSLRAGIGLPELSRLMGHSSVTTTMIYLDLLESDLLKAGSEASPIDRL